MHRRELVGPTRQEQHVFQLARQFVKDLAQTKNIVCLKSRCYWTSELFLKNMQGFLPPGESLKLKSGYFAPEGLAVGQCHSHTWLEYNNRWIIDLTASQFDPNIKSVVIVPIEDGRYIRIPSGNGSSGDLKRQLLECLVR